MQIISSYGVELRKQNIPIRQTLEIYRSAVSYLIGIYVQVWEELAEIPDAKRRFNAAEHLAAVVQSQSGGINILPIGIVADTKYLRFVRVVNIQRKIITSHYPVQCRAYHPR